jgi:photosystem II stability/assembly factor-like uncharacterized protein
MKVKFFLCLTVLALALAACAGNSPSSEAVSNPQMPPAENSVPASPGPINAPAIEAPALMKIEMLNELDGWGVTQAQIARTNDGGLHWYNVTPPNMTEAGYGVQYFVLDVNHAWVQIPDPSSLPNSGLLYRTEDGGMNWTKSATPFSGGDLDFLDETDGWMLADLGVGAGSNAVAAYQTTDGGANWTLTYTNDPNQAGAGDSLPLGGLKSGLEALTLQNAWVTGVIYADGTIYLYRTEDGGHTWSEVNPPLPSGAEHEQLSIDPGQLKFVSSQDGFLAIRRATLTGDYMMQTSIYVTHDAGKTWLLTPTSIPNGGSVDFLSATEAVIYNGEQFYVTRDAADTWNIVSPDIVFGDTFAWMDFVNPSGGWVLTLDPTTNHSSLYRTTDGGSTWSVVIP